MNWSIELAASAIKELKKLPRDRRVQIAHAIDEMEADPLAEDVIHLKGPEWRGRYRKRVGTYQIIFAIERETATISISAILLRSEITCK